MSVNILEETTILQRNSAIRLEGLFPLPVSWQLKKTLAFTKRNEREGLHNPFDNLLYQLLINTKKVNTSS